MAEKSKSNGLFIALIILGAIAVIAIIYFAFLKKKPAQLTHGDLPSDVPATEPQPIWPLKHGSNGAYVTALQKNINYVIFWLNHYNRNQWNLQPLAVDGNWGPATDSAFTTFTGIIGRPMSQIDNLNVYNDLATTAHSFVDTQLKGYTTATTVNNFSDNWYDFLLYY